MANLVIEAVSRGLDRPSDGGVRRRRRAGGVRLADGVRPLVVIAVGTLGDYADVAPEIAERDGRKRERLPLDQVVLNWPVR